MSDILSSMEDMSTLLYKGRAGLSVLADIRAMDQGWRKRLEDAITESGRNMRDVSRGAGLGAGYLHSVLKVGKEPTVANLVKVCNHLGVSLWAILYGAEMSAEDEELLRLYQKSPPEEQESLLKLLRSRSAR